MPRIEIEQIPATNTTGYPAPYAAAVAGRWYRRLAPATGLTDFGASHVRLEPGAWSSQRHWHEGEDEMVVMLTGEAVLVDDRGETRLRPGDIAVFPKNDANGHCLRNTGDVECTVLAIGRPPVQDCHYADIDLVYSAERGYTHMDGTPY
ncbi:cupin domain-containing protein [Cognatilysobacter segetis]|uniref:cupin domain-containing protein n=1 Tax=Cognatilysobacter segetis TaxID=2492394 RepID=UPI00105B91B9|nr:cupin domain-containing protein [Lysobacter segetis]